MSERTRNLPRRSCLSVPGSSERFLQKGPSVPADMTFLDPSGQTRLTLDIAQDHRPVLLFSDAGHKSNRLSLGIENGTPAIPYANPEAAPPTIVPERSGFRQVGYGDAPGLTTAWTGPTARATAPRADSATRVRVFCGPTGTLSSWPPATT